MNKIVLDIPEGVQEQIDTICHRRKISETDFYRSAIKMAVLLDNIDDDPNGKIIIETNGKQRVVTDLFE